MDYYLFWKSVFMLEVIVSYFFNKVLRDILSWYYLSGTHDLHVPQSLRGKRKNLKFENVLN